MGSIHRGYSISLHICEYCITRFAGASLFVLQQYVATVLFALLFRLLRMERLGDASSRAVEALAFLEDVGDASADRVAAMNTRRRELLQERMSISREMKNENRKRQRLLEKARGLSNEALMEIVAARAARASQAKAKAKAVAQKRSGAAP